LTKSFECSDAGVPCKAKVTGETEEEVLAKAVEHAKEAHGVDLSQSKTLAGYARSLIREEGVGEPREEAAAGAP
jgi:predicted small metal-binding protein